jgi:FkbM family methyltransferase
MIEQVELRDGYWWPITDRRCWQYMLDHSDLPDLVAGLIKPKHRKTIVQAGGNAGFYVKKYAELFQTVYTFEPDWLNFYCLNLNVPYSNVIKNQGCLGNEHQLVSLNILEKNRGKNHISGAGIYPVYTIDNLKLNDCSAIQLDIEGYEFFALLGAVNTINKYKPVIVIEMWDQHTNRYGKDVNIQTVNFLESLGYKQIDSFHDSDKVFRHQE